MSALVNIITVHGTFAGDDADEGEKWWQRRSTFLTSLQECIQENLEIEPFHWSGENSELDRRRASWRLANEIQKSEELPIVVGHSHGGSTSVHALAMLLIKKGRHATKLIRGLITIGMPMVLFESTNNNFTQYNLAGRLMLLVAISLLAIGAAVSFQPTREEVQGVVEPRTTEEQILQFVFSDPQGNFTGTGFWVAIAVFIFLFFYTRRSVNRAKIFKSNKVAKRFRELTFSISHYQDEAINGLTKGLDAQPKLVKHRTVFAGIFSVLALVSITLELFSEVATALTPEIEYQNFGGESSGDWDLTAIPGGHQVKFSEISTLSSGWMELRARKLYTREDLVAIPLQKLWNSPDVRDVLAEPDRSWLGAVRDSLPSDVGYVLVPSRFESILPFRFSKYLADVKQKDIQFDRHRALGIYRYAPSLLFSLADEQPNTTAILPPLIFFISPRSSLDPLLEDGRVLPMNTKIFAPSVTDVLYDSLCNKAYALSAARRDEFAITSFLRKEAICVLTYAEDHTNLHRLFFKGQRFLHVFDSFLPRFLKEYRSSSQLVGFALILKILFLLIASAVIAAILAILLTNTLSGFVVGTLRKKAFGHDGFGEKISSVRPDIDFENDRIGSLPDIVQEEMLQASMEDAPAAIQRFRNILSSGDVSLDPGDPLALAMKFDNSELLHNAYFHSPLFIKFLAAVLIEKFGLTPSERFAADLEGNAFRAELRS